VCNGAKESAGKRYGTAGTKFGHPSLTRTCSAAAVRFFRNHPAGQKSLTHLEHTHGTSKALTVFAHQLAPAVSDLLKRDTGFDRAQCLNGEGSGADAPIASLDHHGLSLHIVRCDV
jgi:hypothetical protein